MDLIIDNFVIKTELIDIITDIQLKLSNGKLRDVKQKKKELVVTCPNDNHSGGCESDPDCHIALETTDSVEYGHFHCFACGAAGNFVRFVALCFSSSDEVAKDWLISNYGEALSNTAIVSDYIDIKKLRNKKQIKPALDERILDQYQSWTPYLLQRRLSRNVCEFFKVKYDAQHRQIIFPCYDATGKLVMIPKRNIDNKVFYLDESASKPVYCIDFIVKNHIKSVCLVEGPIDCLTCYSNNIPAIATLGNPAEEQWNIINKSGIKHIYLMFDNDRAGRAFTESAKRHLSKKILIDVVELPKYKKDINDLTHDEIVELSIKYNLPKIEIN